MNIEMNSLNLNASQNIDISYCYDYFIHLFMFLSNMIVLVQMINI